MLGSAGEVGHLVISVWRCYVRKEQTYRLSCIVHHLGNVQDRLKDHLVGTCFQGSPLCTIVHNMLWWCTMLLAGPQGSSVPLQWCTMLVSQVLSYCHCLFLHNNHLNVNQLFEEQTVNLSALQLSLFFKIHFSWVTYGLIDGNHP